MPPNGSVVVTFDSGNTAPGNPNAQQLAGVTWHETGTVNPDSGLDHYMPATDQRPVKSDRNGVSHYRSERVPNENATPAGGFAPCASAAASNTGSSNDCQPGVGDTNSDSVVAGGTADNTPYAFKVVSPVFPPPDGIQSGFNGDYTGFTINRGVEAHPFWADTRNVDPYSPANGVVHDEDIFSDQHQLSNGKASTGPDRQELAPAASNEKGRPARGRPF